MRGKRAKQYRKLMQQYGLTFGFREPYQVLVDAQMIQDTEAFKMDLMGGLERTLSGKIKPMITQCSIRHLYTSTLPPATRETLIATAKLMERRRCNHHTLEQPLSTLECFSSVIDPKDSHTNKNRYIVASQGEEVRRYCRGLKGVPLVYVKRSVMVMEPMSEGSAGVREGTEKEKFRSGIRGRLSGIKRKREAEDSQGHSDQEHGAGHADPTSEKTTTKARTKGPKGPNPLSVKKAKRPPEIKSTSNVGDEDAEAQAARPNVLADTSAGVDTNLIEPTGMDTQPPSGRRKKRRRKPPQTKEDVGLDVLASESP